MRWGLQKRQGESVSRGRAWGVVRSVLRQTCKGMGRRLTAQWVTVGSVAAMQSIFAATLLLAFNLDELAEQWEKGGDVLVFLKPGIWSVKSSCLRDSRGPGREPSVKIK